MSNAEHEPTHRPLPDAKLNFIGYYLGLQFHPSLKLNGPAGWEFAAALSSNYVDPKGAQIDDTAWQFSQPLGENGEFRIIVRDQIISLEARNPSNPLEWFETRCPMILTAFRERFSPKLLLTSVAKAAATLDIDGDSRDFLVAHVMRMDARRWGPLERPIQLLGLRLILPAFEIKQHPPGKSKKKAQTVAAADWAAEVKAESFGADSSKLFLEVSGQWSVGVAWNDAITKQAVGRLDTVKTFLKDHLLTFLTTELKNEDQ